MRKLSYAYFDTSTYLKLYVQENGTEEARSLVNEHKALSSAILLTECFSALSRKREAGEIEDRILTRLVKTIREELQHVEIINLTDLVLTRAEEIVLHSTARALDAIHIASALFIQDMSKIPLTFITSDRKQYAVAAMQGLSTVFVE